MSYTIQRGYYGKVYYQNGTPEFEPLGIMPKIVKIVEDLDTGEYFYILQFKYMGKTKMLRIARKEIYNGKDIVKYSQNGLDVRSSTANALLECLRQAEDEYQGEVVNVHSKLGWKNINQDGDERRMYFLQTNSQKSSRYDGHYDVKPRGKLREWVEFVNELTGNIALQFVLATSISSILLGYFKQEITCVNSIVHIVGDSSSGKTTALKLGISVFGNPEIGANTLAGTWNATKNALLKRLMTVEGVTFGLDESSMFNGDMTKIIYEIGDGTDKERLTKEGNLKRKETGTYVVLSTGESGILCRSSKNNGLAVRAMEIHVEKWTESAEQSEKITEFVQNHYGRVAPAIAKWIENQDVKDLKTRYQEMRKFYSNISKMQGFKERVSIRMGLILLSAEVAKEAIGLDLSYKKICQFITDHEKQDMSTKNNFDDFYEKFKSFLFSHRKYFISGTGDSSGSGEYGSIDKSKFYDYNDEFEIPDHLKYLINDSNPNQRYFITPEKFVIRKRYFKEFVQKEGYEDDRRLLHHLKVKGLLETDEGRLTRKRKLCGSDKAKEEVYVIIIIDEEDDIAEVRELIELAKGNCKKRKQKFPCISRNARTTKENNKNRPLTG